MNGICKTEAQRRRAAPFLDLRVSSFEFRVPSLCVGALFLLTIMWGCASTGSTPEGEGAISVATPGYAFPRTVKAEAVPGRDLHKALLEGRLSVDLQAVPLHEVLQMLSLRVGFALIVDGHVGEERLSQPVTLKLDRTSAYAVFYWLFRDDGMTWAVDRDDILVAPLRSIQPETWNPHVEFVAETERVWREKTLASLKARRMDVDFDGVPCDRAFELIAGSSGLNLVLDHKAAKALKRKIGVRKEDAPLNEILDDLAAAARLKWSLEGQAVYVRQNPGVRSQGSE